MTGLCVHKFIAGKKRGEACGRFVRGQGNLCYQHKNKEVNPEIKQEIKEPEQPVNKLAQSSIQKKKRQVVIYESSTESSTEEEIIVMKRPKTKPVEIKPEPEPKKVEFKQLECSGSSSMSDSSSFTDSSDFTISD